MCWPLSHAANFLILILIPILIQYTDLARAKSEALNNISTLFKQSIKSCNAKWRRQRWRTVKKKTTIGLISKKASLHAGAVHFFLYISLPLFCTTTTWNFQKLPSYTFYGGNVLRVVVHLFFTATHFHLALVAASISHFLTAATKLSLLLQQKMSPLFLSLALDFCRPFSWWASLACRLIVLFSLSFPCSTFQICGHENLSTLENTETETIPAFRFRLYCLFSCLCFTRRGWLCIRVAFGWPYLLIELFYIGMPVVMTDGRPGRRAYGPVITKISQMGRLPYFLTHGAPLRALRVRESSATIRKGHRHHCRYSFVPF